MDSNHSRRPYESRVAPRVVTVAGPGIEPGSLTRWGMSPVGCHCPSLRRPRADSNGKAALRKRSARSPSESSSEPHPGCGAPRSRTQGVARRGAAPWGVWSGVWAFEVQQRTSKCALCPSQLRPEKESNLHKLAS